MKSVTYFCLLGLATLLPACDDDDADSGSGTSAASTTTTSGATSSGETSTEEGDAESTAANSSSSGRAETSTGAANETNFAETFLDSGPDCQPVTGEYNACITAVDGEGNPTVDNTACNYMGMGGQNGTLGCLSGAKDSLANTCVIFGCIDECDCFAAPQSGDATVECRPNVTADMQSACVLSCANGETCPDGMVCDNSTCFWPAPEPT